MNLWATVPSSLIFRPTITGGTSRRLPLCSHTLLAIHPNPKQHTSTMKLSSVYNVVCLFAFALLAAVPAHAAFGVPPRQEQAPTRRDVLAAATLLVAAAAPVSATPTPPSRPVPPRAATAFAPPGRHPRAPRTLVNRCRPFWTHTRSRAKTRSIWAAGPWPKAIC